MLAEAKPLINTTPVATGPPTMALPLKMFSFTFANTPVPGTLVANCWVVLTTLPKPVTPGCTSNLAAMPSDGGKLTLSDAEPGAYVTVRDVLLSYKGLAFMAAAILAAANGGVFSLLVKTTLTPPTVMVPGMGVPLNTMA